MDLRKVKNVLLVPLRLHVTLNDGILVSLTCDNQVNPLVIRKADAEGNAADSVCDAF